MLILETIQDHALVASKHFLVETKDKNLADNGRDAKLHNRNLVDNADHEGNDYARKTTIVVKSTPLKFNLNGLLNTLASSVINSYLFVWLFHCHSGLIAMQCNQIKLNALHCNVFHSTNRIILSLT